MMATVSRASRNRLIQAVVHLVNRIFPMRSRTDFRHPLGFLGEEGEPGTDREPAVSKSVVRRRPGDGGEAGWISRPSPTTSLRVMYRFPFRYAPITP